MAAELQGMVGQFKIDRVDSRPRGAAGHGANPGPAGHAGTPVASNGRAQRNGAGSAWGQ